MCDTRNNRILILVNCFLNLCSAVICGFTVASVLMSQGIMNTKIILCLIPFVIQNALFFYPALSVFLDLVILQTIRGAGQIFGAWAEQLKADCCSVKNGVQPRRGNLYLFCRLSGVNLRD